MKALETEIGLRPEVIRIIRRKAFSLAGRYGFCHYDVEDIEQELLVHCWERLKKFDECRSSQRTFFSRIIDNRIATLIQHQSAARRSYRQCFQSLDGPWRHDCKHGESGSEPKMYDSAHPADRGQFRISGNLLDTKIDVTAAIRSLPKTLTNIADLLSDSASVTEIAGTLSISRSTAHRRIVQIHLHFEKAGLAPGGTKIVSSPGGAGWDRSLALRSQRTGR